MMSHKGDLVRYRMEKAGSTLDDARILLEAGSAEDARFYAHMFDFRQKSDYGDFAVFEKDKVAEWFARAEGFLNKMNAIIEEDLKNGA